MQKCVAMTVFFRVNFCNFYEKRRPKNLCNYLGKYVVIKNLANQCVNFCSQTKVKSCKKDEGLNIGVSLQKCGLHFCLVSDRLSKALVAKWVDFSLKGQLHKHEHPQKCEKFLLL